jgi:hypothetical protein
MTHDRRLDGIEGQLSPREIVCLWMPEVHAYGNLPAWGTSLLGQPDEAYPLFQLTREAEAATRARLKGRPGTETDDAARDARRDVMFLFYVHKEWNLYLVDLEEVLRLDFRLLIAELRELLRLRHLSDDLAVALSMLPLVTIQEGDLDPDPRSQPPPSRKRRGGASGSASPIATILERWVVDSSRSRGARGSHILPLDHESYRDRVLRWKRTAGEQLALVANLMETGRTLGRQFFAGLDPAFPEQADFLRGLESSLQDLVGLFEETLVAEWEGKRMPTRRRSALPTAEEEVHRRLGTPAKQAAYFADLGRARTLQALGDRVGAAGYVEKYLEAFAERGEP